MPVNKRLRSDHNIPRTLRLHKEGDQAMNNLAKRFKGARCKKQIVTDALVYYDKICKERRIKAVDEVEEILGI